MLQWLDPLDCQVARRCLDQGNVLEAARVLLACPKRDHKAVRDQLALVAPQLVQLARQAHQQNDLISAQELIQCAGECADLDVKKPPLPTG